MAPMARKDQQGPMARKVRQEQTDWMVLMEHRVQLEQTV